MIARLVCLFRGHRWYPTRNGAVARDLPGGGFAFRVVAVQCQRCGLIAEAPDRTIGMEER